MTSRQRLRSAVDATARRFAVYYQANGWEWKDNEPAYVPDALAIAKTIEYLIAAMPDEGDCKESTGGIEVWREEEECGISFVDDRVCE